MDLENFGSIMGFALELEREDAAYYRQAAAAPGCSDCRDLFQELAEEGARHEKSLARARQENVTEMTLESVQGLDSADFTPQRPDPASLSRSGLLAAAQEVESSAAAFYAQASAKLQALSGVSRTLSRLAKKRLQRRERLASLN